MLYAYIAKDGKQKTIEAPDANTAIRIAPDRAPDSGVMLVKTPAPIQPTQAITPQPTQPTQSTQLPPLPTGGGSTSQTDPFAGFTSTATQAPVRPTLGAAPTNSLLEFSNMLEQALELSRKKRASVEIGALQGAGFTPGQVNPGTFAAILGSLEANARSQSNVLFGAAETAYQTNIQQQQRERELQYQTQMDEYNKQVSDMEKSKNDIQNLALKLSEAGVSGSQITKFLNTAKTTDDAIKLYTALLPDKKGIEFQYKTYDDGKVEEYQLDSKTGERLKTTVLVQGTPKAQDVTAAQGSVEEFKLLYGRMPKDTAELNAFTASRGAAGRAPARQPGEDTPKPQVLTQSEREFLASLLGQVKTYKTKQEALNDLTDNEAAIKARVGDDGYQKLVAEIDRVFPYTPVPGAAPSTQSTQQTQPEQTTGFFSRLFSIF